MSEGKWVPVVIVRDRWLRACLYYEWAALPCGMGAAVGDFVARHFIANPEHPQPPAVGICAVLIALIGLVRPYHRWLGIPRNSIIRARWWDGK